MTTVAAKAGPLGRLSADLQRRLMGEMPPVPESPALAIDPRAVPRSRYVRGGVYVLLAYGAFLGLLLVLGGASGAGYVLLVSPMLAVAYGVHALVPVVPTVVVFWAAFLFVSRRMRGVVRNDLGWRAGLAAAAMREERLFRAGAEGWTLRQRAKSCAIFGLVHLWNLYVPVALVAILAAGGGYFMSVYLKAYRRTRDRDQALAEAAGTHYAFNCVAISTFLVAMVVVVAVALAGLV